jgi:hypothetical protein
VDLQLSAFFYLCSSRKKRDTYALPLLLGLVWLLVRLCVSCSPQILLHITMGFVTLHKPLLVFGLSLIA